MNDVDKLQGTWLQIAYERDGVQEPTDEQGWNPRTTFKGNSFEVMLRDGSVYIRGTFTLDPRQDPKTMDVTDTFGPEAGMSLLAIYSLDGDRLLFCAAYPGLPRPTEFRTKPGQVMRVMQRQHDVI